MRQVLRAWIRAILSPFSCYPIPSPKATFGDVIARRWGIRRKAAVAPGRAADVGFVGYRHTLTPQRS